MAARITEPCGFRTHLLLAGDVVGTIIDGRPTWPGMTVNEDGVFFRGGDPVLIVQTSGNRTTVRAFRDVWVQELALSVKVAGAGQWRGYGPKGWVPTTTGKEGWLTLEKAKGGTPQAWFSTVHFSRVKSSPRYCTGVEYRDSDTRLRFSSDGGFANLLFEQRPGDVPWEGCTAFDRWPLAGTFTPKWNPLRRWELAGHPPDEGWMHFLGSPGGAGAVVSETGRTPRPGSNPQAGDGFDCLQDPGTWRLLRRGQVVVQRLWTRRL